MADELEYAPRELYDEAAKAMGTRAQPRGSGRLEPRRRASEPGKGPKRRGGFGDGQRQAPNRGQRLGADSAAGGGHARLRPSAGRLGSRGDGRGLGSGAGAGQESGRAAVGGAPGGDERIAEAAGFTIGDVRGPYRKAHLVEMRRNLCRFLRGRGCTLPDIGELINRDHTSVMNLLRREGRRARHDAGGATADGKGREAGGQAELTAASVAGQAAPAHSWRQGDV